MKFNSLYYLAFLAIVVLLYYLVGSRYRWVLLLLASYYFYASWKPVYLFVIVGTTVINYFVAVVMARRDEKRRRRKFLLISLASGLGLLFFFKYFNFFSASIQDILRGAGFFVKSPLLNIIMPIGISFYTLQTIGYILDVYHGRIEPERHLGTFAVYVSFFPIVLSGPIERSRHLLPQLQRENKIVFSYENISRGAKLIILGLFYKLVVADRAAIYVNAVFANADKHYGLTFIAALIFFSFQIYSDFAGYSYVAIGSAKLLGIDILQNFNRPFFAASIKDFWRRWHISLSTWLRDYIFLPVAYSFSRMLKKEKYLSIRTDRIIYFCAIFITFFLCGLWHGANWTFIAWGCLHGFYLAVENILGLKTKRRLLNIGITYILVLFTWIFFRAASISDAFAIVGKIFTKPGSLFMPPGSDIVAPIYTGIAILILLVMELKQEFFPSRFSFFNNERELVRVFSYAAIIALILTLGVFDGGQFIYVQF
jgi:D-alanyl-lipoteichoic acid acyltransferase DltB (MBOAT superfamily)